MATGDRSKSETSTKVVRVTLDHDLLHERLGADVIYLSIGLSRPFRGNMWALVVGVHPVPDYAVTIDYATL